MLFFPSLSSSFTSLYEKHSWPVSWINCTHIICFWVYIFFPVEGTWHYTSRHRLPFLRWNENLSKMRHGRQTTMAVVQTNNPKEMKNIKHEHLWNGTARLKAATIIEREYSQDNDSHSHTNNFFFFLLSLTFCLSLRSFVRLVCVYALTHLRNSLSIA